MFLLALRNLLARLGCTLFTAFAIALGVALVFAMRIVRAAADQQATAARDSKLAGADLEISPALAQLLPWHSPIKYLPIRRSRELRQSTNTI